MKEQIGIPAIVLVCEQAIYVKALEIEWKHHEQFKDITLRLSAFHTTYNFMAVNGKRFCDAL